MSRRAVGIIIILGVAIVVTLMRESGVINISYYTSNISSGSSSSFNSTHITPTGDIGLDYHSNGTDSSGSYNTIPVVVEYREQFLGKSAAAHGNRLLIIVSDISFTGFLWTPLYKSTNFSASAISSGEIHTFNRRGRGPVTIHNISGTFAISGHITIKGICSVKNAKQLVIDHILAQLQDKGKSEISRLQ